MRRLIVACVVIASPALAQAPATPGSETPATAAYKQAAGKMMAGMDVPYTGDADRDFVQGMLPHHQGAIDMARVEAQYGHDPEMKQLAHDIIVSQTKEVGLMRRWLLQHPPKN